MSAEFRKMFRNCNLDRDRNSRLKIGLRTNFAVLKTSSSIEY